MSPPSDAAPAPTRGRPRSFDRDQALDAAMRVFWAKGYSAASMTDLTAAMGIASPSLYAAFGCKEALFREALDRYASLYGETQRAVLALPTARESVEGLLRNAVRVFASPEAPTGCMVMQTATDGEDLSPDLARTLCELRAGNTERLMRRLEQGVQDGDVGPGTDIRAVADFYATVHKGLSLSARGGASAQEMESVVTSAMAAWTPLINPQA
mgnify:CR=1 FL=1|jgi:Transcriptional regulator